MASLIKINLVKVTANGTSKITHDGNDYLNADDGSFEMPDNDPLIGMGYVSLVNPPKGAVIVPPAGTGKDEGKGK